MLQILWIFKASRGFQKKKWWHLCFMFPDFTQPLLSHTRSVIYWDLFRTGVHLVFNGTVDFKAVG